MAVQENRSKFFHNSNGSGFNESELIEHAYYSSASSVTVTPRGNGEYSVYDAQTQTQYTCCDFADLDKILGQILP